MYTYKFSFGMNFTADDPTTPVSGPCNIEMVFQADNLDEAKAKLASALDAATSVAVITVTGIYQG